MPSTISWLDQSADEQRRVRELVQLFSDSESRDELGIGQVRDVFSNRLFPGTSVIQTRTRYFLFIPWIFQHHQARGYTGAALLRRAQESERHLIATMRAEDHLIGLIGRDAGPRVKTLPSAIYWNGLQQFGVLQPGISPDAIGPLIADVDADPGALDERADRAGSIWNRSIPSPPDGFPGTVPGGFALTVDEATWFRDLTLRNAPGTLLAHLVASREALSAEVVAPWTDPIAQTAPEPVLDLLAEARRFSLVMHGAALLYNLVLGEAYEAAGHTSVSEPAERYRIALEDWSVEIASAEADLAHWSFGPWWSEVVMHNPRIGPRTREFVAEWLDITRAIGASGVADDARARTLIQNRERATKRGQARLTNARLLKIWNGASGTRPLTYRWGTVHRLVSDVIEGMADDAGA